MESDSSEVEQIADKKIKLTKYSINANLNFNVNVTKKWIVSYLKKNMGIESFKINNAHILVTAFGEELLHFLIYSVIEYLKKNKIKLYEINIDNLKMVIKSNDELNEFYSGRKAYDDSVHYMEQYFMDQKLFDQYIEVIFGKNIIIEGVNINYLFYLLTTATSAILMSGELIREFSKRTTLTGDMIICATKIHFKDKLLKRLLVRMEDANNLIVEYRKKDKEEKAVKKPTKKKGKKEEKKSTKKNKKEEETTEVDTDED